MSLRMAHLRGLVIQRPPRRTRSRSDAGAPVVILRMHFVEAVIRRSMSKKSIMRVVPSLAESPDDEPAHRHQHVVGAIVSVVAHIPVNCVCRSIHVREEDHELLSGSSCAFESERTQRDCRSDAVHRRRRELVVGAQAQIACDFTDSVTSFFAAQGRASVRFTYPTRGLVCCRTRLAWVMAWHSSAALSKSSVATAW